MVRVIRTFIRGVRFILPWVIRAIGALLWTAFVALSNNIRAMPGTIERMANEWRRRAFAAGFPTEYDTILYYVLCVAAFITIVVGWIVQAFLTVGVMHLIFG